MGSAEGGNGADRWWESPTLTQADLRQYGESWSLAADAATATLLQSISQRLVSRTHEVENALKKVLEETDSVMVTISNTNNSFHQLANTQFIENRTYQDDADVARDEPDCKEKPPPTEEEIIARCRSAIAEGLALVNRSYERHEIHDSDSDDDDSPSSPLPVYALINPYEVKPLPHVIGTALFMEDDKLGLQESSSEDNSKITLSPEETDSEDDMEDETDINQKHKPIPQSSSRIMDDSDSDWSDEGIQQPVRTHSNKPQPPHMTSEEDDDDKDDEDFFGPSTKSFRRIDNGPNLSSELNKKFQGTSATSQNSRRIGGLDSDSDDEGGLFGRRPDPPAPSSSTVPSSTGVENVRAMPDPARIRLPAAANLAKKSEGNLFASDSDDEGDLFGSKTQSSVPNKGAVRKESSSSKTSNQAPQRSSKPASQSGGLFSSDKEDEEDGGLFATKTATSKGASQRESDEDRDREEPPPLPKADEKKVPVGGVNIFGSAITSAIRRQQSSDSEQSDDGSDWGESRKSSVSASNITKPLMKQEPPSIPTPTAKKVTSTPTSGGSGLFDDDEDDDLFGSIAKKNTVTSQKTQPKVEKSVPKATTTSNQSTMPKKGLFSDDEDDLFSISAKVEKKPINTQPASSVEKSVPEPKRLLSDPEDDLFSSGAAQNTSTKPEQPKATNPIKVPAAPQKTISLFSSPSDDDDLFSVPVSSQAPKPQPALSTEPPPISSSKADKKDITSDLFGSPGSDDNLFSSKASIPPNTSTSSVKDKEERNKNTPQSNMIKQNVEAPTLANSIFNSQSDDDDLFSSPRSRTKEPPETKTASNKVVQTPNAKSDIFGSPEDDLFGEKLASEPRVTSGQVASRPKDIKSKQTTTEVNSIPKSQIDGNSQNKKKKVSLFGSPEEDDIFSSVIVKPNSDLIENKPSDAVKTNIFEDASDDEDIFSIPTAPKKQNTASAPTTVLSSKSDNELPVNVEKDKKLSEPSIVGKHSESPGNEVKETISPVRKPPIGGVALFGGDELKAKINERKSVVSPEVGDFKTQTSKSTEEKAKKEEKSKLSTNKNIFDGESDDFDIFGSSQTSVERIPPQIIGRGSPPPLPSEVSDQSPTAALEDSSNVPKHSRKEEVKEAKELAKEELSTSSDLKEDEKEEPSPEKKTKKPPIGGVSMFGGKGLGGSELFAKVNQRRSMLGGAESDSDNETKDEETRKKEDTQEETKVSVSPSKTEASPTLPVFTALPAFGAKVTETKSGGQENSVSFDEPTSSTNTLESINKTRVRGSVKRRPPSRAHRRGAADENVISNSATVQEHTSKVPSPGKQISKAEVASKKVVAPESSSITPPPVDQIFSSSENEDDLFSNTVTKKKSEENTKKEETKPQALTETENDDDLFRKPRSASSTANAVSLVKPSNKSRSSSLFGEEEDTDEEDLFGASKSRSSSIKTSKPAMQQQTVTKQTKPTASQSLFGDDDDDIFSSAAMAGKTETSVRKISTSKLKTSLQSTNEPFDDPLLGPRK